MHEQIVIGSDAADGPVDVPSVCKRQLRAERFDDGAIANDHVRARLRKITISLQ
jgi:hypothetical protein